jgi:nucleotide-binding universal stress UspA family protein
MSYNSIIVFLDNSAASERRLDFALQFARQHNAHLSGLHMSYGPLLPFDPYGQVSGVALEWEMEVEKKQAKSRAEFIQKATNAGINFDWDCYRDTELFRVVNRARLSDICLAGQVSNGTSDNEISRNFFSQLVIALGKPILFLPHEKACSAEFKNIVVAWNGSRESTRAIADAMPLLQSAKIVSVISAGSKKKHSGQLPDVDVAAFLARHKVKVDVEKVDIDPADVTDLILSRIELKSADLLVMGAYGHTRFSEFVLGGMTRSMMKKMTVPVLMSH